ncbi:Glycosyl transferase [Vibrio chagasii]|nr:Glycosyl transferase [Vibrio chagasii]CAH6905164.1 Glycosyl transferase [Vibrio chagasii]CAH6991000.1 Glycosyl transferase [Vibrio chagasii]CAH7014391.1 Glycosyl transferase [Vibrio chagasii]
MAFELLFWVTLFLIIHPFITYPLSLMLLGYIYKDDYKSQYCESFSPSVTLVISAYNEQKVIANKLNSLLEMNFDIATLEVIVTSDGSTDRTHEIVNNFIAKFGARFKSIELVVVEGRLGKTNAQNKAVERSRGDIIAFSDSNSIWEPNALDFLVSRFKDDNVAYVSGMLKYTNHQESTTSESESRYWEFDLYLREVESRVMSTVGGNGAIYAIRQSEYIDLPPMLSHDGFMPTKVVLKGKTAKFEKRAIATEKAGENSSDEFGRKVRMQRGQPWKKYIDISKFNFFKFGWFSYFYFSHKYLKYCLYILHPSLFIFNIIIFNDSLIYLFSLVFQSLFYIFAILGFFLKSKNKLMHYPFYYSMTIVAQAVSVYRTLTGKSKATWEKAETTR